MLRLDEMESYQRTLPVKQRQLTPSATLYPSYYEELEEIRGAIAALGGTQYWYEAIAAGIHGRCRLTKDSTNLLLSQDNGRTLIVNSAPRIIPDAGVTLGTGGLSASTTYNIYAFMSGATLTLEASTTAHAVQAGTGVRIKSGDATRTLVGKARTNGSTAWEDTATKRFVLSWFNRRNIQGAAAFTANRTHDATGGAKEIDTEIRVEAITWGDDIITQLLEGPARHSDVAGSLTTYLAADGSVLADTRSDLSVPVANENIPVCLWWPWPAGSLAEGHHTFTLFGTTGVATATWVGGVAGAARWGHAVVVQG